ncbi:hypothetical protein [Sulfuricurvum sp.]|uniref:hypothetical protein n=1 Tax=Sulfuricurvum sp. TaxID=2025608 RepID=UPI002D39E155|nr:hypothetical protein [Sulfuricurvum sp.]HZF69847.1 hypothetical protein [Sulfuricurvum sp.]
MNAAERLATILKAIITTQDRIPMENFSKVFGVSGCIPIHAKLKLCESQIKVLEGKADPKLIGFLYRIFSCLNLQRDFSSEVAEINNYLIALNSMSGFMGDDMGNIDPKDLTDLADMIEKLRAKMESGTISESSKSVIESFLNEMRDALADIELGGIVSFIPHAEICAGKIIIYNNALQESGIYQDVKDIFEKVTKILDSAQIWGAAIGFAMGKLPPS